MTPLPQRKKTAEEIAQLRDQLGVPPSVVESGSARVEESASQVPVRALELEDVLTPDEGFGFTKVVSHEEMSQKPAPMPAPTHDDSKLPVRRRSEKELEEMRRREMLNQLNTPPPINIKFMSAHPALIGLGYLLAIAGVCSFWVRDYPWPAVAGGSAGALMIAGFMALRRPVSRHHAGFICAISMLVGVFATIHHFPQLQHAS